MLVSKGLLSVLKLACAGPPHRLIWSCRIRVHTRSERILLACSTTESVLRGEAIRSAMIRCMHKLGCVPKLPLVPLQELVSHFCIQKDKLLSMYDGMVVGGVRLPIADGEVIGVDFEGHPEPSLVQIACSAGLMFFRPEDEACRSILRSERHVHAVFGRHEMGMVANPLNVQERILPFLPLPYGKQSWSLADCFQIFGPIRGWKDKSIHERVDWSSDAMTSEMKRYACVDAIAHMMLAFKVLSFEKAHQTAYRRRILALTDMNVRLVQARHGLVSDGLDGGGEERFRRKSGGGILWPPPDHSHPSPPRHSPWIPTTAESMTMKDF